MGEKLDKPVAMPASLESEIREGRKFTLAEAIGRLGGPGMMKGVSPTTRRQQAEAVVEDFLECLVSPAGALNAVLLRQAKASELVANDLDHPLHAFLNHLRRILDSDYSLQELVREADCEWGRVYGERPYFEKPGKAPNADDPYTVASVRSSLLQLVETLSASEASAGERS